MPAMRYAQSHKQETRRKVVRAAAAAVRVRGPAAVAVAEIMAEAGLTHGGFYGHFPSKEALVAAAVEEAFNQSSRRFTRPADGVSAEEALSGFIDAYVSTAHRSNPERGCPIACLASDVPRQGPMVRAAFDAGLAGLIAHLEAWLPEPDPAARRRLASSLVAEMVGVVALSRAVSDEVLAEELLDASRAGIKARIGLAATAN
jgi:TetR/AcrR family transcriptional repressor of nem operon